MSKTYQVYGIGNALVDYEFAISESTLRQVGLDKGAMTLCDIHEQQELQEKLAHITPKRASGGSAANTLIALAQFGGRSFYSCKVANDADGKFYYQDLLAAGVDTNVSAANRQLGTTGTCVVLITPDAERTMSTYLGITSNISSNELVPEALADSSWLYMEGYLAPSPSGLEATLNARELARQHGTRIALTLSDSSMVQHFRPQLDQMVGNGVDLLFCNETEAQLYTGCEDTMEAGQVLRQMAHAFVITRGARGALLFDGRHYTTIQTPKVKAIDTNGAGDMFAGAFLYGINNGMNHESAASFACHASASLVTHFGPRLTQEQAREVLQGF